MLEGLGCCEQVLSAVTCAKALALVKLVSILKGFFCGIETQRLFIMTRVGIESVVSWQLPREKHFSQSSLKCISQGASKDKGKLHPGWQLQEKVKQAV